MAVEGFDLSGRRALVVGAESDIGGAICRALGEAGARVIRQDLPPHPPSLKGRGTEFVGRVVEELGGLDVVVHCGDLKLAAPFAELTDDEWELLVAVNLTAPLRLLRAAGREMLARGGGRIILIVSMLGERGLPNTAAYGACHAGQIQLIRALALEWARQNVRVNGIALGWLGGDPLLGAEAPEALLRFLPARRLGRPEEVGALAVYLASEAADLMTGQVVFVDGGVMSHA